MRLSLRRPVKIPVWDGEFCDDNIHAEQNTFLIHKEIVSQKCSIKLDDEQSTYYYFPIMVDVRTSLIVKPFFSLWKRDFESGESFMWLGEIRFNVIKAEVI